MKTTLPFFLCFLLWTFLFQNASAFNFNPTNHIQVYYDYCEEDVVVSFVYFQSAGDNDRMNFLYFKHNPSSGAPITIIDFRHTSMFGNETGWDTLNTTSPQNQFAFKTYNSGNQNWQIVKDSLWEVNDQEGHKYWVRFRLRDLPASVFETFSCSGFWRGQGSNSPDLDINTQHPLSLYIPDTPTGLTASQNACDTIKLNWSFSDFEPCAGKTYKFRLFRDNSAVHFAEFAANTSQTNHTYSDPQIATSTSPENHSYKVQVIMTNSSGLIYQSSNLSGQAIGYPLPLPAAPGTPTIEYSGCNGAFTLNWQNPQIYTSIIVTVTPATGTPIIANLPGSSFSYSGTLTNNGLWNATITGVDACNHNGISAPLNGIKIPQGPGAFTLNPAVENNGTIQLSWTPSANATEYSVKRNNTVIFNTNASPLPTTYTDELVSVCTPYTYTIEARNSCGPRNSNNVQAPIISQNLEVWDDQTAKLACSKGYYGNRVELTWDAPVTLTFDHIKIYRKVLGASGDGVPLDVADKNALSYVDLFAQAGVLYEYSIRAYGECNGSQQESTVRLTDVGFRLPIATVTGNVQFENGSSVADVEITVERNSGALGKSLYFDGQGLLTVNPSYADDPMTVLPLIPEMTIDLWINPQQLNADFSLFQYVNGSSSYGLYYSSSENSLVQYYSNNQGSGARKYVVNNLDPGEYTHLSWNLKQGNLVLYVNGLLPNGTDVPYTSPGGMIPLTFGAGYIGYLDEVRFWDKRRTTAEIRGDYGSILAGDENHLLAYWRMDEGLGTGVYDISGINEEFNARHLFINTHVTWSDNFPATHLLGNVSRTDSTGNYVVRNIRYSGVGSTFTVIPFLSPLNTPHEFEPASRVLFLGEGNNIQNGVNFIDKSSFNVTGSIKYILPDSMCDNTKALIYVDDRLALINGVPVKVENGTFSLEVPIGLHRITVRQDGHTFANKGIFPPDGGLFDFQEDISGIEFFDSTLVRVIGRVAGGTREGNKKPGLGKSKNNIGVAEITFTSQLFSCHSLTVITDSLTGEYAVDLLPVKYDVAIEVVHNPGVDFGILDELDLSIVTPMEYIVDTVFTPAGQLLYIDSVAYNKYQNYIYRAMPELDLVQAEDSLSLRGEPFFTYVRPQTMDTTLIPLNMLPFPAFMGGKAYKTIISAFESYTNMDNPQEITEDRVPVTDGTLTIRNGLGNSIGSGLKFDEFIELNSPDGDTMYTFYGGQPEFVMDGSQSEEVSFTKTFEVQLETPTDVVTWLPNGELFRGYVFGSKPVDGSSFITQGPEVVDLVLRDPPGDGSSTSITKGKSISNTESWFLNMGASLDIETRIAIGWKVLQGGGLGYFVGSETKNIFGVAINANVSFSTDLGGSITQTTTFEETMSTSQLPYFTGAPMDLFIGKSTNYLFGKSDELGFIETSKCDFADLCFGPEIIVDTVSYRLAKRRGLYMVPQDFETTFAYSQFYIESYLIPNLEGLRNDLFISYPNLYQSNVDALHEGFGLNNDDPYWEDEATSEDPVISEPADESGPSYTFTPPPGNTVRDEIRWFNQQIRLWKEALAQNEQEKALAETVENISFDAATTLSRSVTRTKEETESKRFEVSSSFSVGAYMEAETGGSGSSASFMVGLQLAGGAEIIDGKTSTEAFAFELADGQPGDFFSIDVKKSKSGHSPIFSLRGGQSMCPWEQGEITEYYQPGTELSVSTIRRELPEIDVEPSFQANVPEHQPAKFRIKMRNASPTDEIQWYGLRVLEQTNPFGATLKIDGFSPNTVFEIPAGETIEKTLELYKGDTNIYEIKLMLYSTCEYEGFQNGANIYSTDTITISAHFVPACSPVSIRRPVDLWVHNVDEGQAIEVQLQDYSLDDANLENLRIQYKPSFTSTWKGLETFWKTVPGGNDDPQIPPGSNILSYLWDIEEIPDGPYDIRVVSHCTDTDNDYASPAVRGIVDRIRPHAFGNPQPADGVLDPNDEIMIQFNEPINPASVMTSDFDIRAVLNGTPLRHETSIELDGVNDYVEIPSGARIGADPFTIEMWIKRLSNGAQLIWSQGEKVDSSMALGFNANNRLFFRYHDNTIISNTSITADNQWYHIAVTCNENRQINFFVTGEYKPGGVVSALKSIPGNMVIGKAAWANNLHFHGYIHEVRIWHAELTEGMIRTQMLKKLSGAEAGLSMLWPMDEGTGVVLKEGVRKKNATLYGNWSVLPSGSSLVFGGNYLIDVNAGTMVFSKQHSFTLEFWLKGSKTQNLQTILSNGKGDNSDGNEAGWSISANASGKVLIHHGGQEFLVVDKDVLNNNWHHIAIVLNRQGNLNTYLDGNLATSIFGDAFGEFAGSSLWIGKRGWYEGASEMHDQPFTGALDEIRVWNTKLTAEYIRASMHNRLAGDEFGVQLYLPFETYSEVGGIPVLTQSTDDQSPFNRALTLSGPPQFQAEDPNIKLVAPFEKVNFTYSINGDKIIITPTTDPLKLERTILYISLKNVEDHYGNEMAGPINWTAFVNKNQLQWEDDELYFEKPEKEGMEFTARIINSGGIELSFEILGLPDWLEAHPAIGTIAPVTTRNISFTISPDIHIGDYSTDINLLSGQGYNDKLALDLHVFGVPPAWEINPSDYQYSMTVVADLDILGELSEDPLDRIVAYINGEVRGLATMQYLPELDRYLAFMDIYSNGAANEQITFKVWDAGTGTTYAGVNFYDGQITGLQTPFVTNKLIGNAVTPARWIVNNDIIQEIPVNAGWTWISFNVNSQKFNHLNNLLSELSFENNDLVQNKTGAQLKSATYNPSTGWQGNLANVPVEFMKMYQCDFTYADILRVSGPRVNPDNHPVSISTGINWIPMLSSESIEINEALSSFEAVSGDWVKSQNKLAVYHPTQGWVGTLSLMEPGKGYILNSSHNGTIYYPFVASNPTTNVIQNTHENAVNWRSGDAPSLVRPQEKNMTIIAVLDSELSLGSAPVIAAYASGQLLELAEGIPLQEGGRPYYYFTLQGHDHFSQIYFDVYDATGEYAGLGEEQVQWSANHMIGSHDEPFVLHLRKKAGIQLEVYPNPFEDLVHIMLETTAAGKADIRIFDMQGQSVYTADHFFSKPGMQYLQWNGKEQGGQTPPSGTYIIEVVFDQMIFREKVIKI